MSLRPTVVVLLAALPEARVEVSEGVLVLARLPDVVDGVGQLPLPDLGQLVSPQGGQSAVVGVLGGALCGGGGVGGRRWTGFKQCTSIP